MRCRGRPRLLYITDSSSSREVARTRGGEDERLEREGTAFDDPFSLESSSIDFWRPFTREPFSSLLASRRSPRVVSSSCPRALARAPASVLPGHGVRAERLRGVLRPPPVLARGRGARSTTRSSSPSCPRALGSPCRASASSRCSSSRSARGSRRASRRAGTRLCTSAPSPWRCSSPRSCSVPLTPDGRALAPWPRTSPPRPGSSSSSPPPRRTPRCTPPEPTPPTSRASASPRTSATCRRSRSRASSASSSPPPVLLARLRQENVDARRRSDGPE